MNGVAPMLGKYILSFSNKLYSMLVPHNSNVVITYPYRLESCLRRHTLNTNTLMNIVKKATTIDSVTIFIAPSNPRVLYNPTENSRQVTVAFRTVAIILLAVTVILALFK